MRRTRWDQKPDIEEPIASGSRWSSQCPVDWEHHNRSQETIPNEIERLSTPHPLDYSSDNRQRDQKNANAEIDKNKSDSNHRKNASDSIQTQNPVHPSHWSYMSSMPQIYPGSSQNAQVPYSSHAPWSQIQQGFFSNREFHGDHIFDMKWWEEQRLPLSAHLNLNDSSKEQQEKLELSRTSQWSFGTRVPKHSDRGYDMVRRYARYQNGNYDKNNKSYRDLRNFPPNTNMNDRYKFESYKRPLLPDPETHNPLGTPFWRYNNNREYLDHSRPQDYSQTYRPNLNVNNNGSFFKRFPHKFKVPIKNLKEKNHKSPSKQGNAVKKKRKKEKKNDSAAESAKKKALAAAANKLKKTFLAAKKNTNMKFNKKSKVISQNKNQLNEIHLDINTVKKAKVQDLSVPKSIPKEGTSLEHDIDIKFSAHEWESVGRGEGGTHNVLDSPIQKSKSDKEDLEEINSDSDSVQTINDDDSVKELSDYDSDKSESSTEEEEEEEEPLSWSTECRSPTQVRRRHVSETIKVETEVQSNQSKARRVRSYSTSQVEQISPQKMPSKSLSSSLTSNLKNMLVKQLLSMDKKSLKELVDDPKSRKAQFMMNHFMTMHRSVLSQKLNQLRFKSISSPPSAVEDSSSYHSFNPAHLEDLPSDLLQQVKEILEFEANGKAQQMWEEVSLSLSDLVSGLEGTDKPSKPSSSKDSHQPEEQQQQQEEPLQQEPQQLQQKPRQKQKQQHSQLKQLSHSPPELGNDDMDCQIVTPPPKLPATTITIPDSDNEIPIDILAEERDCDTRCPPPPPLLISSSLNKNLPTISPSSSSLEPRRGFIKPRDLTRQSSPLDHPDRPPNPVPRSPPSPLPHMLAPPSHPIKQSPLSSTPGNSHPLPIRHPTSPFLPPNPSIETKRLKINIKSKLAEDSDLSTSRENCEINMPPTPSSIKVKQERPSPMMECGLCMHPPRSPHTPQCGFAFGMPQPPVALMPGSPRPLGAVPPQRPVPHLASAGVPTIFKQERHAGSYLNLEHVNRPSSEERPKNPAPPDTTSSEPPSPLPIPPPQSTLHQAPPPPRPLIFSPEEPPRPPSPPPPQHSPRIKLERQTPQFICCCMRNECERSNSSRQSADFRRSSTTPQGQLCESASLRATPHSLYKFEAPYLSGLRSRTPHNGIVNMFPSMSPSSARCLAPSNASVMQGLLPSQCLGVVNGEPASTPHHSKVTVGVQTEVTVGLFTEKLSPRQLISSHSLVTLPVSSLPSKTDQTTSTEDLASPSHSYSPSEDMDGGLSTDKKPPFHMRNEEAFNSCSVPTSSVPDDHVAAVLSKFRDFNPTGCLASQLFELSNHEREALVCLDMIERKDRELARERKKLSDVLRRINEMRHQRLVQQQSSDLNATSSNSNLFGKFPDTDIHDNAQEHLDTNDNQVVSNSTKNDRLLEHEGGSGNSSQENQYMVSSSQEITVEFKSPVSPSEYFSNDSHSLQGERCTSTSLLEHKEPLFPEVKGSSDSEEELEVTKKYGIKSTPHQQYRLGQTRFMNRRRLNSGSTSDEFQEEKIKENTNQDVSIHSNNISANGTCFGNSSSDMDLKKEVLLVDSSDVKFKKEGERKESDELDFTHNQETSIVKVEHEHLCNLTPNRKGSLSGSPQSPKMRNSSGSEHGYSLRSRGPPSDLFDFNSDSQLSKDTLISGQEDHLEMTDDKQQQSSHDNKQDDDQADDELEKEEDLDARGELRSSSSSRLSDNDSLKKRKRKRKTRYQINKCRKKKDINNIYPGRKQLDCPSSCNNLEELKKEVHSDGSNSEENKRNVNFASLCEEKFTIPPAHMAAVLNIKVVGNLIFTTSIDGTARLFDPVSGVVLSTYQNHTDSVTAIQVVGEPQFTVGSPGFQVITGSEDCSIHVYDGKTGVLTNRKNCSEPVRCFNYRWGYLFIGTDGGSGIKWNLKDKKLGERIQFCGKGITQILTHVEGGRKVLVVGAKTTPIMIRDAMSGLFLRTLDYVQLTIYSAVFEGNLLYAGGTDKTIFIYDYCAGSVKGQLNAEASVSDLILRDNHLLAVCYDGFVRIFRLPKGDLVNAIRVESSNKIFICSALFRNKILIGNKNGEILCCNLPDLNK